MLNETEPRVPALQPCPNEECTCRENPVNTARMCRSKDSSTWQVDCSWCEMRGPNCATEARAESTWNALPRAEPWVSVAERMPELGMRCELIHSDPTEPVLVLTIAESEFAAYDHGFESLGALSRGIYTHWRLYREPPRPHTPPRGPVSR